MAVLIGFRGSLRVRFLNEKRPFPRIDDQSALSMVILIQNVDRAGIQLTITVPKISANLRSNVSEEVPENIHIMSTLDR